MSLPPSVTSTSVGTGSKAYVDPTVHAGICSAAAASAVTFEGLRRQHGDRGDCDPDIPIPSKWPPPLGRPDCDGGERRSVPCGHDVPPLRGPRRLLHRGRRRPPLRPAQRAARLGGPGGRGARPPGPPTSVRQPGGPWPQLRRDHRREAGHGARVRARPGHDLRRSQRHPAAAGRPRRTGGPVRRGAGPARRTGARLLVWTAFDPGGSAIYRPMRGRFALYNELVRRCRPARRDDRRLLADAGVPDWRFWDTDRMHMGSAGRPADGDRGSRHPRCAGRDFGTRARRAATSDPPRAAAPILDWTRSFAVPWVHRRLTGRSSGDTINPRRPDLGPVEYILPRPSGAHCGCLSVGRARPSQGRCRSSNLVIRSPSETPGPAGGLATFWHLFFVPPRELHPMWFSGVSSL